MQIWSSIPRLSSSKCWKPWTQSHSFKYSMILVQLSPPRIAETQASLVNASATVCLLQILGGTHAKTLGARFSTEQPCTHLSVQKRVVFPFPNSVLTAAASRAKALGWDGSSRLFHGRSARVFFYQCHLACKAHAITSRLGIPSPPRSRGLMTFSHETKQQPPLACSLPFQRNSLLNLPIALVNHFGTLMAINE